MLEDAAQRSARGPRRAGQQATAPAPKMRPKTEIPHMLGIRIHIYLSRERNRQAEMLAQRAVRLNGIGAGLVN
jgi:hypothetical protein